MALPMPHLWPMLNFDADGLPLIRPCLHFEAHVAWAEGPEILDFYEKARSTLGALLTHTDAGARKLVPVSPRTDALVPTWCAAPTPAPKKIYQCHMQGGDRGVSEATLDIDFAMRRYERPTPAQVELAWRNPNSAPWLRTSMVRVTFPLDHPMAAPEAFLRWLQSLKILNEARTVSATAGFAINVELANPPASAFETVRDRASAQLLRFPGLDAASTALGVGTDLFQRCFEYMDFIGEAVGRPYIKRVNWLTFLTEDQVRFIGGADALHRRLSEMPAVRLHAVGKGLLVQAGPAPRLGDVTENDVPPEYCLVADSLQRLRLPRIKAHSLNAEFRLDGCRRWLSMLEGCSSAAASAMRRVTLEAP